jgi:transcription antitermination factor NusG
MSEIGLLEAPRVVSPFGTHQEVQAMAGYSPAWFAVFTVPRHEKRVSTHFENRQIESFLPLYTETRRWKNRCKVAVDSPLFPCYIFTRIDRRERVRVLNVPGVVGIIGRAQEAVPVPDECIESLRRGLSLGKIQPHVNVTAGDRVRIIDGPMSGMEGLLMRVKNDFRVVVRLDAIMQCLAIEVSIEEVELLR